MGAQRWRTWREATADALYGPDGFYHRVSGGPGHHYRTSSTASPHFAAAVARLARDVDVLLGQPAEFHVVEVGAARGALLTAVGAALAGDPGLAGRLHLTAVELAERPSVLPPDVRWVSSLADMEPVVGLVVANEWLDNIPVDVVELTGSGVRLVEVDDLGDERLGAEPGDADREWLARWWPGLEEGDRAELGGPRDLAWAGVVERLARGLAVAVDYAHVTGEREAGAYCTGTLTGYRDGRSVLPVPDGSCDITAHVALDACAHAGELAGATATLLTDQRTALRQLGVSGVRPAAERSRSEPVAYLRELSVAGEEAELIARGGLGDFGWLVQARGVAIPGILGAHGPDGSPEPPTGAMQPAGPTVDASGDG